MIVLKILGIVFASLIALILAILLLPVDVVLRVEEKRGVRILIRILGIPIPIQKKKEEAEKKEKKSSSMGKGLKKALGISHLEKEEVQSNGLESTLQETVELVMMLVEQLGWIAPRLRIPRCRITLISGGEDAAMEYGLACAALYPLVGYLQERAWVRKRGLRLQLSCDFALPQTTFELDLAVRLRVWHAAVAAVRILKKNLAKEP
ncbi:MAG: hypothetical protein IJP27_00550 [Clostridia bacterium]|nr:hypothetical protein [Clostridia bacterium]